MEQDMRASFRLRSLTVVVLAIFSINLIAQGKSAQQTAGSGQSSNAALPGLSYAREQWNSELSSEPTGKNFRILCFALMPTRSGGTPFVIQSVAGITRENHSEVNCSPVDKDHPLIMDSILAVAIDARLADTTRIKLLNINVTTASGTVLSPNPIRPSFGSSTSSSNLGEAIYFLTWPVRIPGDAIPTVSVNASYTPPVQGQPWQPFRLYPPSSIVTPSKSPNGHFYETLDGGESGKDEPTTWNNLSAVSDGDCQWMPSQAPATGGGAPKAWTVSGLHPYLDIVSVPLSGLFYVQVNSAGCTSAKALPSFAQQQATTKDILPLSDGTFFDGTVQWRDTGGFNANCKEGKNGSAPRKSITTYATGQSVCNPSDLGRVYSVAIAGISARQAPFFPHAGEASISMAPAVWIDLGQTVPPTVTGTSASDIPIALNLTLPQSHSLYFYNLSSGVFVSTIHSPTFAFAAGATSTTNSGNAVQTSNTLLVDPVITLTRYIKPFDAERSWRAVDMIPALGLSFSLSAPTSNFYVGGSSEVLRYVQVNYGFAAAKVSALATGTYSASSATTPPTTQVFKTGAYFGLSFNISGLISSVTSGSSGGSSKSSSASSGSATQ
jgi:hypothetical protein